jgi:uncharacterized protein (TIGR00288 family)
MSQDRETNLALFIDFDNVALGARDARQRFDITPLLQRLLEKGKIIVKKAYADWHYYKEHMSSLHEAAIELIEIPMPRISGKNSADIKLVVDAMDLCYSKEHIDTFVIVSGDSDFSPLVSKLRENNKRVIGIGVKNSSSKLLIGNCDEFIFYDDIYRQTQRVQAQPVANLPADKRELFEFLVSTVQSLLQESRGVLYSSLIKDTMTRKQPAFTERAHGFSTFGDLLDEARQLGLLLVERDAAAGGTWVVHGVGAGGTEKAEGSAPADNGGTAGGRSSRRRRRSSRGSGAERTNGNAPAAAGAEAPEANGNQLVAAKSAPEATPRSATGGSDTGEKRTDPQRRSRRSGRRSGSGQAVGASPETKAPAAGSGAGSQKTEAKPAPAKPAPAKPAPAKPAVTGKTATRKPATKKTADKQTADKKTATRKPTVKKTTTKAAPAKTTTTSKAPARKTTARKPVAKKTAGKVAPK